MDFVWWFVSSLQSWSVSGGLQNAARDPVQKQKKNLMNILHHHPTGQQTWGIKEQKTTGYNQNHLSKDNLLFIFFCYLV